MMSDSRGEQGMVKNGRKIPIPPLMTERQRLDLRASMLSSPILCHHRAAAERRAQLRKRNVNRKSATMPAPHALRLMGRRVHVFGTALAVYSALKACELCGLRRAAAWEAVHTWCARRLLHLARGRRGLWVKCAQYVASRGDVVPEAYVRVLGECLDDCPPDEREVVERIVREEVWRVCGKRVGSVFVGFDGGDCLASASVAGVYRARLKKGGREVVLKVQHPEVGEWLLSDLRDLEWVLGVVGSAEPEFDLRVMLQAWLEKVPGEIDFRCEMENVLKVRRLLEGEADAKALSTTAVDTAGQMKVGGVEGRLEAVKQRLTCSVPRPVEELTTDKMFVMDYVDGCKLTDIAALNAAGVDLEVLVEDITRAFGLQLIVSGYLHGDLHPGNILVEGLGGGGGNAVPVFLDYGVMVELDDRKRLGFARLIIAAYENDSYALLASFSDMGIELNRADPTASMELINFLFRSTVSREQTVQETTQFRDRMIQHREDASANTTALAQADVADPDETLRRPLVESYPGYLIFFLRTLACLRGLATLLDVQHEYLPVLAEYSRRALRDACPVGRRMRAVVYRPSAAEIVAARGREKASVFSITRPGGGVRLEGWRGSRLRARLEKAFEALYEHDLMVGMQVAVYHKGELVCDMAAGKMGRNNPRPVRNDTLFCGFGASEVIPALLVAQMQDRENIAYEDRLGKYWPEYGVAGKENTTVGDLLTHATGLCGVSPSDMSMRRLRDDRAGIVQHLEAAEPVHPPGSSHVHKFYDLNFGWLAAELVERVSGLQFPAALSVLTDRLGISAECYCGNMPAHIVPDTPTGRVASLCNSIISDLGMYSASAGHAAPSTSSSSSSSSSSSITSETTSDTASIPGEVPSCHRKTRKRLRLKRRNSTASLQSVSSDVSVEVGDTPDAKVYAGVQSSVEAARFAIESLSASLVSDEIGETSELDDLNSLPEYMLEPSYFNSPILRSSCVPSANAHFSARALARLYACFANDGEVDGVRILRKGRVAEMMRDVNAEEGAPGATGPREKVSYGGGLKLYDVERKSGRVEERGAIGCSGLGGSFGIAIPGEHNLAIAVTVNKLNIVSAASALAVYVVCKSLGAPVPSHIAKMERKAQAIMKRDKNKDLFSALKGATASDFATALAG